MNITDIIEQQAECQGDLPCVLMENETWNYKDLDRHIWRISKLLHHSGVRPGDVVAHTFIGEPALLVSLLATARIGASVFGISPGTPDHLRDQLLKQTAARWLATDQASLIDKDLKTIVVSLDNIAADGGSPDKSIKDDSPLAPWILASGSGSTGKSKLMPIRHEHQWNRMKAGLSWLPYTAKDILVSLIPLDFYAPKLRYLEAFAKGASIALVNRRKFSISNAAHGRPVTVVYGTVFHAEQTLKALPDTLQQPCWESLSALMVGGSTVSSDLRNRICTRLCSKLYILYGANECSTTCCASPQDLHRYPGLVGPAHEGFELQIVDGRGHALKTDQVGLVRIKSRTTIDGYLNDDVATKKVFRDGWFYPGDLGKLTPDGQLIHMGRADDLMIANGVNIYPAEIEQALYAHPEIIDVVAIPLKHEVFQDIPICAVELSSSSQASEKDLISYAVERLGAHAPARILSVRKIPRNDQGKLIRAELNSLITEMLRTSAKRPNSRGSVET